MSTKSRATLSQETLFPLPTPIPADVRIKRPTHPLWTENKAHFIARYLYYFVLVTKHGTYIDLFAGPQDVNLPDAWSAKLVLESKPQWLRRFYLCDRAPEQVAALRRLVLGQPKRPKREIRVLAGDANVAIKTLLKSHAIRQKEAVFCLLDQRTFECDWSTVEALAAYKQSGPKIELFYFLANGWFDRALAAVKGGGQKRVEAWWGRSDWGLLKGARPQERALAFADRFRRDLGYRSVKPWPIYSREQGRGKIMYYMIHATDHLEAPRLMARAYEKAVQPREELEQLRLELWPPAAAVGMS